MDENNNKVLENVFNEYVATRDQEIELSRYADERDIILTLILNSTELSYTDKDLRLVESESLLAYVKAIAPVMYKQRVESLNIRKNSKEA